MLVPDVGHMASVLQHVGLDFYGLVDGNQKLWVPNHEHCKAVGGHRLQFVAMAKGVNKTK